MPDLAAVASQVLVMRTGIWIKASCRSHGDTKPFVNEEVLVETREEVLTALLYGAIAFWHAGQCGECESGAAPHFVSEDRGGLWKDLFLVKRIVF